MAQEMNMTRSLDGKTALPAAAEELMEYRRAKAAADAAELRLEEFCTAIEEFGLRREIGGCPYLRGIRRIRCRDGVYTPCELMARAEDTARELERLTETASGARGRVLTKILHQSRDMAEYRALRCLYIDLPESVQRTADRFPPVQGGVS